MAQGKGRFKVTVPLHAARQDIAFAAANVRLLAAGLAGFLAQPPL
jgi:hypothetical protein